MHKTYSERRQDILFKAARQIRLLACEFLDEIQEPHELTGSTAVWAASVASHMEAQANRLQDEGLNVVGYILGSRDSLKNSRSKNDLDEAFRAFKVRIERAREDKELTVKDEQGTTRLTLEGAAHLLGESLDELG